VPDPTLDLAYAYGPPQVRALIRARPEDFEVDEVLRFQPSGDGEHVYVRIRKRGLNTLAAAKALARHAGVRVMDVGYSGMKDRNAVTTQWFSVALPGSRAPDWGALTSDAMEVVETSRHGKKLRPGQLMQNRFRITLRWLAGAGDEIEPRLSRIESEGVPNYFGPQRFGRDGANLQAVREIFLGLRRPRKGKVRGIYLSAARAQIFNHVLSARVASGSWNRVLPGEVLMFDDSRSRFPATEAEISADPRLSALELHPTGPLWGRGSPDASGEAAAVELRAAEGFSDLAEGLETAGVKADRRALRLRVADLRCREESQGSTTLSFALRPGAFATAVLREVARLSEGGAGQPG
jgi:tRNA pseudouridine13 synthase